MKPLVLFVVSKENLNQVTSLFPFFKEKGWDLKVCEDVVSVVSIVKKEKPCLIFSEASFHGYYVEKLLEEKEKNSDIFPEVIVFSAKGSCSEAGELLNKGAKDYWLLPLTWEKVQIVISMSLEKDRTKLKFENKKNDRIAFFIGNNEKVKRAVALAKKIAPSNANVLIFGESGTGKEVLARLIHYYSPRKNKPFIAINCAALPVHLLESELFGYEKGAFTGAVQRKPGKFELAQGGSILLDEISEMDIALQAKLLRVIQEKEFDRLGGTQTIRVDVRILSTTNRDLEECVKNNQFREDLYYRINVIPIYLPPLRKRGDDIILLAKYFLEKFCKKYSLPNKRLSVESIKWLKNYHWPGNVRELQNYMERAVLLTDGEKVEPEHFDLKRLDKLNLEQDNESQKEDNVSKLDFVEDKEILPLYEVEKRMIFKSLDYTKGNRTKAAELLGISVRTLRNKLNEYKKKGEFV